MADSSRVVPVPVSVARATSDGPMAGVGDAATDLGAPRRPTSEDAGPRDAPGSSGARAASDVSPPARDPAPASFARESEPPPSSRVTTLPASAITTPAALRDILSRRVRADPPRGFRPDVFPPEALAGLPLSFVLTLMPDGFAISKPPANSSAPLAPPPPYRRALEHTRGGLHPYDRSSVSLFRSIDAGRLPRGLLDGIPLAYAEGAALVEVRDYRGRDAGVGKAAPRAYVAVLHPTPETIAVDADEIAAQLDAVAPVTGEGYDAPSRAESLAAAKLARRLAVEGALLAATSAPLCLDPNPEVATARRLARDASRATARFGGSLAAWSRRSVAPGRTPRDDASRDAKIARDARRRKRWVEAAGELQPPLAPSAGLNWAAGFESDRDRDRRGANGAGANGAGASADDGERVRAEGGAGPGEASAMPFASRGFPDEDVVLDPLRGETVWDALDPDAAPPPARPATGDAWAWAREEARTNADAPTREVARERTATRPKTEPEEPNVAEETEDADEDAGASGAEDDDGGHLRLVSTAREAGWRAATASSSLASEAADVRAAKRRRALEASEAAERARVAAEAPGATVAQIARRNDAVRAAALATSGPAAPVMDASFREGAEEAIRRSSTPVALAAAILESDAPATLAQRYDPEWSLAPDFPSGTNEPPPPLRFTGRAARDGGGGGGGGGDMDGDGDGDDAARVRIDVGPGTVEESLAEGPGGREPVVVEMPPFPSAAAAGQYVLAFHRLAAKEGLVRHARAEAGTAAGAGGGARGRNQPGSAP